MVIVMKSLDYIDRAREEAFTMLPEDQKHFASDITNDEQLKLLKILLPILTKVNAEFGSEHVNLVMKFYPDTCQVGTFFHLSKIPTKDKTPEDVLKILYVASQLTETNQCIALGRLPKSVESAVLAANYVGDVQVEALKVAGLTEVAWVYRVDDERKLEVLKSCHEWVPAFTHYCYEAGNFLLGTESEFKGDNL